MYAVEKDMGPYGYNKMCYKGKDYMTLILDAGVDPNVRNKRGQTAGATDLF